MDYFLFMAIVVIGLFLHARLIEKPKQDRELKRQAEKVCSYMKYGEVLIHIARIKSILERDGVLTDKERALLPALEARRMALKASATPESIEKEIYEYNLMANRELE